MGRKTSRKNGPDLRARLRQMFTTRDFIFHDGRDLKRFSIAGRTQAILASIGAVTVLFSAYGVAQATVGAIALSGLAGTPHSPQEQMALMRRQVERMQTDVASVKQAAEVRAARLEQNQAVISALLTGKADRKLLSMAVPVTNAPDSTISADVLAPLQRAEHRQLAFAVRARQAGETRYAAVADHIRKLGLNPDRYVNNALAMGGPFVPVDADEATTLSATDETFRTLFLTWKKLDVLEQTTIAIPSLQPVDNLAFTSNFGVRSDPFRGTAAMHEGVDIPGPVGTPVYATADGIIERAERAGGYGNMIEINHGRGIETRYGHLSRILVAANTPVHRGQLIGLMGSTGRSTGPHLHYEVRVDGHAVNPVPFLATATFAKPSGNNSFDQTAVGGPDTGK